MIQVILTFPEEVQADDDVVAQFIGHLPTILPDVKVQVIQEPCFVKIQDFSLFFVNPQPV